MKIILVPTDFSGNSLKALKFAIQTAIKSKSKIVLMLKKINLKIIIKKSLSVIKIICLFPKYYQVYVLNKL